MQPCLAVFEWIGVEHRFLGLEWSCLTLLGLLGNAAFSSRFIIQWVASERRKQSVIPVSFWYWSIAGSLILLVYFIFRRDPVGILACLPNSLIYMRNLNLIKHHQSATTVMATRVCAPEPNSNPE